MKYVFFGSPEFAAQVLKKLLGAGIPPVALVCNPDRPSGRHKVITPPATKRLIQEEGLNIKVFQPEDKQALMQLSPTLTGMAEFGVVAAYALVIPKSLIDMFGKGIVGVHPSLLPKYRGASPIRSAMLAGEEITGASLFMLDEKVDHGPILVQRDLSVGDQYYEELVDELAALSGNLLAEMLPEFSNGSIEGQEQDHSLATLTKKFTTEDAFVDPGILEMARSGNFESAREVFKKIRAFNPEPGAFTIFEGKRTKLLRARMDNSKLVLEQIQKEGKKPEVV